MSPFCSVSLLRLESWNRLWIRLKFPLSVETKNGLNCFPFGHINSNIFKVFIEWLPCLIRKELNAFYMNLCQSQLAFYFRAELSLFNHLRLAICCFQIKRFLLRESSLFQKLLESWRNFWGNLESSFGWASKYFFLFKFWILQGLYLDANFA